MADDMKHVIWLIEQVEVKETESGNIRIRNTFEGRLDWTLTREEAIAEFQRVLDWLKEET